MFHSTISLLPQKIPVSKFLMTSLHVICGLGPPNQKSWLSLCPEKHLAETTLTRMYISLDVHLAETTLSEITSARRLIWQKIHLPVITFPRKLIFQNLHFPEFTFGRNNISPKTYFPEIVHISPKCCY